ncbi:hypothetical protein [Kibdelosporangium philippinense]|uniref:hypothetical protein n=1 Tax=Kibdelosporangium philippinense TaxID=211113 RepID=UPI0036232BD1
MPPVAPHTVRVSFAKTRRQLCHGILLASSRSIDVRPQRVTVCYSIVSDLLRPGAEH